MGMIAPPVTSFRCGVCQREFPASELEETKGLERFVRDEGTFGGPLVPVCDECYGHAKSWWKWKSRKLEGKPRKSRRLVTIQMNLEEIDSLPPLLRARVIGRAARKSLEEQKLREFQDALDCEEDP